MSVLIAGAGPAGSTLANILSDFGLNVILVERLDDPAKNAFSSAAIPISAVNENLIPHKAISSYWSNWHIYGPDAQCFQWSSVDNLGVVLDFAKYRQYLWEKAEQSGVNLLLGWKVLKVISFESHASVFLVSKNGVKKTLKVNIVIDATGYKRSLLGVNHDKRDQLLAGNGIEWILQCSKQSFKKWGSSLSFFIGSQWIKHGYGWIFPMSNNRIKIGVCQLPPYNNMGSNLSQLRSLLKANSLNDMPILDKHGGIIRSTIMRSEVHFQGRVLGVGDAISTSNLLGGEGIRHAITSANILSRILIDFCKGNEFNSINEFYKLSKYQHDLNRKFGWRWIISNKIAKKTWWGLSDKKADKRIIKILHGLYKKANAEDISNVLFEYKFGRFGLRLIPYLFGLR
ncbi:MULTISPECIES: NAD(P)/FAD-dependent oxidoreductase [Prochlorococcus]|uniref:NAD(P)/FAD-dependent oxidoreductase n=1 Tax=Prochlorococcus TaxID=1218 RepID=UPI000533AC3E|nr:MULTISPECIES: NAD(P)/FAD-dependent oxidoreductase [Prochlorococcus]KGG12491.1 NAD binding site [Prochlorococcus sp. MIT 0601]